MNPLVSVNILSYNRKDELRTTLKNVFQQSYKKIEVIVVDNASVDGSPQMVEEEFPQVKLIKLPENIGIAGWNKGFEVAKGEYVLVLDDDSYPSTSLLENFINSSARKTDIIALRIENTSTNETELDESGFELSPNFIGCGAILSKQVVNAINGFRPKLFIYHHEIDFTLRARASGYTISFFPEGFINHSSTKLSAVSGKTKYYLTRNPILILLLYFNLRKVIFRVIRIALGRIISSTKQGSFWYVVLGVVNVIANTFWLIKNRKPLQRNIQEQYGYGSIFGGFHFNERGWKF